MLRALALKTASLPTAQRVEWQEYGGWLRRDVIGGGLGGLIARIGTRTLLGFLRETAPFY